MQTQKFTKSYQQGNNRIASMFQWKHVPVIDQNQNSNAIITLYLCFKGKMYQY